MIRSYSRQQLEADPLLLSSMHEDRKRVFVDTLRWEIDCDGSQERDEFDHEGATYLVAKDRLGTHWVSMRLLDTEQSHILGSIFPYLCESGVPTGPQIKEITRYIASPRIKASERHLARNMICRALIEYALREGIEAYTAVVGLPFLAQILAAGWRCDPLGLPQRVGHDVIGAFCLHVEKATISKMVGTWRYGRPALDTSAHIVSIAA